MTDLEKVAPPALPLAGQQYTTSYEDGRNNILRLFFNRITSTLNSIVDALSGSNLKLENLPTSDPGVAGQVWRDGTDLKVSEG